MKEGAFALIDCLGFKGIWNKANPANLINKLTSIEELVLLNNTTNSFLLVGGDNELFEINARLLSDTVAISLQYKKEVIDNLKEGKLVYFLCNIVIQVLNLFINKEPELVLRGCISFGQHISKGNFIVGQAVDESAEYMDIAEGAFVWLLPSAAEPYRAYINGMASAFTNLNVVGEYNSLHKLFSELLIVTFLKSPVVIGAYYMPIKGGNRLKCSVVNPLSLVKIPEIRRNIINTYSKVITGKKIDIWLKHQNTIEYLELAFMACAEYDEIYINAKNKVTSNKNNILPLLHKHSLDQTIPEDFRSMFTNMFNAWLQEP